MRMVRKRIEIILVAFVLLVCGILGISSICSPIKADASTETVTWENITVKNALCFSRTVAPSPSQELRMSTTSVFYPQSSGDLWYTGKFEVFQPLDQDGYPFFRYAAAFSGDVQQTGPSYLSAPYIVSAFPSAVIRSTSTFIPESYDVSSGDSLNVWSHGGSTGKTILGTIAYNGMFYDFGLSIPWIGYKSVTISTGQMVYKDGANFEVIFYVRTGPNKISVKANTRIALTSVNAFAFRLAVES